MPPVSKAQARYLSSQHPDIAARWKAEGAWPSSMKGLPEHVKKAAGRRIRNNEYGPEPTSVAGGPGSS